MRFIFALEVIGQVLPSVVFKRRLGKKHVLRQRGGETHPNQGPFKVNEVNAPIAAWNACFGKSPGTELVPSAVNWADAISRFDFTEADKRGWTRLEVHWAPSYKIIRQAATNCTMSQAVDNAIKERESWQ